jgi:hypothetical protein
LLAGLDIDWDISPNKLLGGDLSALDSDGAWFIECAAAKPEVIAVAKQNSIDPTVLVIALIAWSQSSKNRSAARIAKTILGDRLTEKLLKIAELLGLD